MTVFRNRVDTHQIQGPPKIFRDRALKVVNPPVLTLNIFNSNDTYKLVLLKQIEPIDIRRLFTFLVRQQHTLV